MNDLKGLSGAKLVMDGEYVIKTDIRARGVEQIDWLNLAAFLGIPVPQVTSKSDCYRGETVSYKMLYIDGKPLRECLDEDSFIKVLEFVSENRGYPDNIYHQTTYGNFKNYQERVEAHIDADPHFSSYLGFKTKLLNRMLEVRAEANHHLSFCHGDLSLNNIIRKESGQLYYLDPNPMWGVYSSWLLDASKFLHSLQINDHKAYFTRALAYFKRWGVSERILLVMTITHDIRALKYAREQDPELYAKLVKNISTWIEYV